MRFSTGGELEQRTARVSNGRNKFSSPSPLFFLQKKAEAAHRILEGLGPQVELVSVTAGCGEQEVERVWRGAGW